MAKSTLQVLVLLLPAISAQRHLQDYVTYEKDGRIKRIEGALGSIDWPVNGIGSDEGDDMYKQMAADALTSLLGYNESVLATKLYRDTDGESHIRFNVQFQGQLVDGASIMMHVDETGTIYSVHGEFIEPDEIDTSVLIKCRPAMLTALSQTSIQDYHWESKCELSIVYGNDGYAYQAWKRTLSYTSADNEPHKDTIYASTQTGDLVAVHPMYMGALKLTSYNCNKGTRLQSCSAVSSSTSLIDLTDNVIEQAHNNMIKTYQYYKDVQGRDSYDNLGSLTRVYTHYDSKYNNAYWAGSYMVLGDGDGSKFGPLVSLDVVAHEFTHGVTQKESNLVYQGESGALNEAMSDIMASVVERYNGNSISDTWKIGESVYTPTGSSSDALRYMSDPAVNGKPDHYANRYRGSDDGGGVHINSGIANLAFVLAVQGGPHPRSKSPTIGPVGALDPNFDASIRIAAGIFYQANANCLTRSDGFADIKYCTALKAGRSYRGTLFAAWDAVGVGGVTFALSNAVSKTALSSTRASDTWFVLDGVQKGETVTCKLSGGGGTIDMWVRFASTPGGQNECVTKTSCQAGPSPGATRAYVSLYSTGAYSGVSLSCERRVPIALTKGVALTGQSATIGTSLVYRLASVPSDKTVNCLTSGANGDADFTVQFTSLKNAIECQATNAGLSYESCSTRKTPSALDVLLSVTAKTGFTGLSVSCDYV